MRDLNELQFFAGVVEHNGFSAASRALGVPKSSVSRNVSRLEERLGVRLIERSTRGLRLTEVGILFYDQCRVSLASIFDAESKVADHRSEPSGIIRVSAPTAIARHTLAPLIPTFLTRYPRVRLQLLATNRPIDLIEDRIDVAIRARVHIQDEDVTMRRLGTSRLIFVASPTFARANANIVDPKDLVGLPFLSFQEETPRPNWTITNANGRTRKVAFDPLLWTSDISTICDCAAAGLGLSLLPIDQVEKILREGRLVQILPEWHSEDVTVYLIFATRRGLNPAVRVFIDHVADGFRWPNGVTGQASLQPNQREEKRTRSRSRSSSRHDDQ